MKKMITFVLACSFVLAAGAAIAQPFYLAGDFNGWNANTDLMFDDGTNGDAVAGDGIHSRLLTIATAGRHEYKNATLDWAESWPGSGNNWFITDMDNVEVLFIFNTNAMGDGWLPDSYWGMTDYTFANSHVVVGDLGDELGGTDWDPAGSLVMHDDGLNGDDVAGDGFYTFSASISTAGTFNWKVACNGDWGEQYGSDGPGANSATWAIDVLNPGILFFVLDTNTGRIYWGAEAPVANETASWSELKNMYR